MARYIDADKLINKMFPIGLVDNGKYTINAKEIKVAIDQTPTADVVPKREVERLQAEVDRLLELVGTIPPDRVEFVSRTEINAIKENLAREIFEEIENAIDLCLLTISKILNARGGRANGKTVLISKYDVFIESKKFIAELKKKYTEEKE